MAAVGHARDGGPWTAVLSHPALRPDRRYGTFILRGAPPHGREPTPCRRLLAVSGAVLLVRLGDPSQRLPLAWAARRFARAVYRGTCLCRAADGGRRISCRTHHRHRAHGQMELPARGAKPWACARRHAGGAAHLSRSAHAARAHRRVAADPSFPAVARHYRPGPHRSPGSATGERLVGGAVSARRARLHHRHPARVSPVDCLRAVLRLALPEGTAVIDGTDTGGGDQGRKPQSRRSR